MTRRKSGEGDGSVSDLAAKRAETLAAGRAKGVAASRRRKQERLAQQSSGDGPSRWELYLKGQLPVAEWDDQELARAQTRNVQGIFAGRPPTLKAHQAREIKAELLRRGERDFSKYGLLAIKTVARIMVDDTERAADRLRAANIFLERCYGRVPEQIKMAVQAAWQEDIDAVMTVMQDSQEEAG